MSGPRTELRSTAAENSFQFPRVQASYFGCVLGLSGLATNWRLAAELWGFPNVIGEALYLCAGGIWAVFTLLYVAKWVFARKEAYSEFSNPVQSCFLGLLGVSPMLVALGVLPYSYSVAGTLFALGAVFTLFFAVWLTGSLWEGNRDPVSTTAALYLPAGAGSFVTAIASGAFGHLDWGQLAFGAGFFSWLAIESVVLHRLLTAKELPELLRPIYREGTYAARVRFADQPVSGPAGDQIVESFYTISPQKAPMDPDYSELDFEYLPNGGWGETGSMIYATSWFTFRLEPWFQDNVSNHVSGSQAGWHTLVSQVADGKVRYFVDGKLLADHGGKFYPRVLMSINFNLWFIKDGAIKDTAMRRYQEDIDWVFHQARTVLSPAEVEAAVASYRKSSVRFKDNVAAPGPVLESPCNF